MNESNHMTSFPLLFLSFPIFYLVQDNQDDYTSSSSVRITTGYTDAAECSKKCDTDVPTTAQVC